MATLPTLIVWADADQIFTDKHRARCGAEFCDAIASWCAELAES
ncbi:hypothetical protein [Mycobacteroides salmoniphilum]|nr:hypothetical protein [Mycobacteroides salmoniphilum]